jgi:2-polyprenyl-3-methyl-5-hydroxy-6-metoxy-1,4-benzoquinol methylase
MAEKSTAGCVGEGRGSVKSCPNSSLDTVRKAEAEWAELIKAVAVEFANKTDPGDDRVQQLADRWIELVEMLTDGGLQMHDRFKALYTEGPQPDAQSRVIPDAGLIEYIHPAVIRRLGVSRAAFEEVYRGFPPWEIGSPQPEVVRLEAAGAFCGDVLDVGCGRGENALYLAAKGHNVIAIDFVEDAIRGAIDQMNRRNLRATFIIGDVFQVGQLGRTYDTVLDSATFHNFTDQQRLEYVSALEAVVKRGGTLHLICFSQHEKRAGGPRRITAEELTSLFAGVWQVQSIRQVRYSANGFPGGALAWAAQIRRG